MIQDTPMLSKLAARLSLTGLVTPLVAVAWSVAFQQIYGTFIVTSEEITFIFVLAWAVSLLNILTGPFTHQLAAEAGVSGEGIGRLRWILPFAVVLLLGIAAYLLLFRLSVGLMPYLFLPAVFGLAAMTNELIARARKNSRNGVVWHSLYAGAAFAFLAAAPAYFEKMDGYGHEFMLNFPAWNVGIFVTAILLGKGCYQTISGHEETKELKIDLTVLTCIAFTLLAVQRTSDAAMPAFYFPVMASAAVLPLIITCLLGKKVPHGIVNLSYSLAWALPAVEIIVAGSL